MEPLPQQWTDIYPDTIYQTNNGLLVSFSQEQTILGIKYDQHGKHLKAIEKGQVSSRGNIGLVPSQEEGYDLKTIIVG